MNAVADKSGAPAGSRTDAGGEAAPRRHLFEVQRERRWRVWLLFGLLVLVALVPLLLIGLVVGLVLLAIGPAFSVFTTGLRWYHVVPTLAVAVIGAAIYWYASQRDARRRLLTAMGGRPLDPHDRYHQRFANVVEELRLASGRTEIEAVIVPSYGFNAFAFSDMHGGSVVGVSEGAISGLSRQQLQAVVAHEFAHILSGSHVTVTAACLLFGMWDSIGRGLDSLGDGLQDQDRAFATGGAMAGGLLLWIGEVAGGVVNGALSRQREFEADLAAVRYTRDPLSLALALRTIAEHPVGRGHVPPGLAALCITGQSDGPQSRLERLQASHPPVEARIAALLTLANVSRGEFLRQASELADSAGEREHVQAAPGMRAAPALQAAQRQVIAAAAGGSTLAAAGPAGVAAAGAVGAVLAGGPPVPPAASSAPSSGAAQHVPAAPLTNLRLRACPTCGGTLEPVDYEGVRLAACPACGGRLTAAGDVARLVARREVGFTPQQHDLARQVVDDGIDLRKAAVAARFAPKGGLRPCPRCGRTMLRRHYSYDLAVDVDYCGACDAYWFDRDELEVVQIVAEQRLG